jgi:hypothetical protein
VVLDRVAKNPASHAVWYSSKSHVVVGETGIIRVFAIASAYVLSPLCTMSRPGLATYDG